MRITKTSFSSGGTKMPPLALAFLRLSIASWAIYGGEGVFGEGGRGRNKQVSDVKGSLDNKFRVIASYKHLAITALASPTLMYSAS